jgi:hypothetical protein
MSKWWAVEDRNRRRGRWNVGGTRNGEREVARLATPNQIPQGGGKREIRKRGGGSKTRRGHEIGAFGISLSTEQTRRSRGGGRTSGWLKRVRGLANGLLGVPKWCRGHAKVRGLRCGRTRDGMEKIV